MMIWSTYGSYHRWTSSRWSMQVRCIESHMCALVLLVELSAPVKTKLRYKERRSNKTDPIQQTGTSVEEADLEADLIGLPVHFANQKNYSSILLAW